MDSRVIELSTGSQETVYDITGECAAFLREVAGQGDGLLHVFVPHATAGVALVETGSGTEEDLLGALREILPPDAHWRHRHGTPGHGRDHVLPAFVAPYTLVPVICGEPALGTWQSVVVVDPDVHE